MFDGARPGLALPPRSHFGIQLLFGGHDSMLHRYVRTWAAPVYHLVIKGRKRCRMEAVPRLYSCLAEARSKRWTIRGKEHLPGFWRLEREAISKEVSRGTSFLLSAGPRLAVDDRVGYVWFLLTLRIRSDWMRKILTRFSKPSFDVYSMNESVLRRAGWTAPVALQLKGQYKYPRGEYNADVKRSNAYFLPPLRCRCVRKESWKGLMESSEVELQRGKSWSHFLSEKMGVNSPRMRSAPGDQHAIVSCHSNVVGFIKKKLYCSIWF